ncbi:MAG: PspC domain-containing protein [Sphingobacteriales bacterium]|nr:PspC domain-containing protein [Sphingobacteriales bacterium]
MDKTISINIGGVVFHITEEAHDLLQNYFETLRKHFVNQEGSDEIMGDIEARVAEMFTDRLKKEGTQVITNSQVSNMIDIMGLGYTSAAAAFTSSSSSRQQAKRLFRNEDDKKIGGVCSGISAYFGIADPLWLRLIVLLLFFLSGGGVFLIYIVLLVVIPPARTAADKLAMRGESINIANIEKTVKDNWSDIQNNLNANQAGSAVRRVGNIITDIVQIIAALIIKLIKWLSGFTGIVLAFTLFVLLMASIIGGMISFNFLKNYIIDSPFMLIVGWISLLLVVFLPLIWLALLLARWIFNFDFHNRKKIWLGWALLGCLHYWEQGG